MSPGDKKRLIFIIVLFLAILPGLLIEIFDGRSNHFASGDSMQHSSDPSMGIIDNGVGMVVTRLEDGDEPVTYVQGLKEDHKRCGDYGDVVCFEQKGEFFKMAHRLVCYVEINRSSGQETADLPYLGIYNVTEWTIQNYGFRSLAIKMDFKEIFKKTLEIYPEFTGGYVTKGDNRQFTDQFSGISLVPREKIIGTVQVRDNELVRRDAAGFGARLLFVLIPMLTFAIMLVLLNPNRKILFETISRMFFIGMLAFVLIQVFLFILNDSSLTDPQRIRSMFVLFGFALVPLLAINLIRKYERFLGSLKYIYPLSVYLLFIPAYYLFYFSNGFLFNSFIALSVITILFHLRPHKFIAKWTKKEFNSIGNWLLIFGLNMNILLMINLLTFPYYWFLIMPGVIWGIYLGYGIFKSIRPGNGTEP